MAKRTPLQDVEVAEVDEGQMVEIDLVSEPLHESFVDDHQEKQADNILEIDIVFNHDTVSGKLYKKGKHRVSEEELLTLRSAGASYFVL